MTTTTRTAALGVFAATLAVLLLGAGITARAAYPWDMTLRVKDGVLRHGYHTGWPQPLYQVESHNEIVVTWNDPAAIDPYQITEYLVTVGPLSHPTASAGPPYYAGNPQAPPWHNRHQRSPYLHWFARCFPFGYGTNHPPSSAGLTGVIANSPPECFQRIVPVAPANNAGYSERFSGLSPGRRYYVGVRFIYEWAGYRRMTGYQSHNPRNYFYIITAETPTPPVPETPTTPDPETPTPPTTPEPETPDPPTPTTPDPETPDPETPPPPDPEAQSCTYKHRLIGVYGARTNNTYSAEVLVSSKVKGASIVIRAYQGTTGTELDVLDRNGSAVGPDVTLGAAHSLRGFRPEGAAGRHTVIVKHPSKAAMDNATVALQLRGPEVGFQVVPVPGIEHCTPASTTTETPMETPAPDLVMRDPQALLWPQTFDWSASVVNIGDAAAAPTTVRVYSGARLLDTKTIDVELAAGSDWPMSDYISRDRPSVGDVVRICVAPVPGEAVPDHANNCASATVERN